MEDGGHDHADLVAADDDEDHREVRPGHPARHRRRHPVPKQQREEEDEAEEMSPDVESLIVQREDGAETLGPALARSVSVTSSLSSSSSSVSSLTPS